MALVFRGFATGKTSHFGDQIRENHRIQRDAISRGETIGVAMVAEANSLRAGDVRRLAKENGIYQNDPLLLRAVEAQEKADWKTSSWMDMEEAVMNFVEAYFDFKDDWPPNTEELGRLIGIIEYNPATPADIEEFRRLANETLREWQPHYSEGFKKRIESALKP
jgi:hypothetical protein